MRTLVLLIVGYFLFHLVTCTYRISSITRLKEQPIRVQMAERRCPVSSSGTMRMPETLQTTSVGPYDLQHAANYLQIGAGRYAKAGQVGVLADGRTRTTLKVDQAIINIHTLAPDMVPHFLMSSEQSSLLAYGDLYWVGIDVFWSEDGSFRPPSYENAQLSSAASSHAERVHHATAALVEEELSSRSGWTKRFTPTDENESITSRSSGLDKIVCSGLLGSNQGTCHVTRRIRDDLWIQYAFKSENLACWRDTDRLVLSLLDRFSNSWTPVRKYVGTAGR